MKSLKLILFPKDRPSPLFFFFGFMLNVIVIIVIGPTLQRTMENIYADCSRPRQWLGTTAAIAGGNMAFMLYMAITVHRKKSKSPGSPRSYKDKIIFNILLYDNVVYIYALTYLFLFSWNTVSASGPSYAGGGGVIFAACEYENDRVDTCRLIMWLYLIGVIVAFAACFFSLPRPAKESNRKSSIFEISKKRPQEAESNILHIDSDHEMDVLE
eukprot:TRINITY_DN1520_c3_g1_i1.p1 TRINITY_DN1520_c3_g1~~TRINITY_DN1520_c3_g1_i1.p1  ORF type:complete len:213 (+),score=22.50 TRINITY_DN1520_c3_g1_i1:75-713(+)